MTAFHRWASRPGWALSAVAWASAGNGPGLWEVPPPPPGLAWGSAWEGCRRVGGLQAWSPLLARLLVRAETSVPSTCGGGGPPEIRPDILGATPAFLRELRSRACVRGGGGGRRHFRQLHSCGRGGQMLVQGGRWGPPHSGSRQDGAEAEERQEREPLRAWPGAAGQSVRPAPPCAQAARLEAALRA